MAGGAAQPHIVCGDFNSTPDSPVYQLTHEGYLNDTSVAKLQQLAEVKLDDGRVSDSACVLLVLDSIIWRKCTIMVEMIILMTVLFAALSMLTMWVFFHLIRSAQW